MRRAALLALLTLAAAAAPAQAAGTWTLFTATGSSQPLFGGVCFDVQHCWAVGKSGAIIATTDAGATWPAQTSNTLNQLNAVDCPTVSRCYAAGNAGTIDVTTDGGTTWAATTAGTKNLNDISCVDATHCWAAGANNGSGTAGTIYATSDGSTWSSQAAAGVQSFNSIYCADLTHCWAVGGAGLISVTTNGGASWATQTSGTTNPLNGVGCLSTTACWAAGKNGTIVATTNGGSTWSTQTSGTANDLFGIACAPAQPGTACWAVGASGTVVATNNGGAAWASQTSNTTNQLSWVSAANPGRAIASTNAGGDVDQYVDTCSTGALGLTVPAISFPSTALNGQNRTATTTAVITPDDETRGQWGWNVTATSTLFTNGAGKTLPANATTITSVASAAHAGQCSAPTNSVTYPLGLPAGATAPTAVKLFNAAAGTGMGPTDVTLNLSLAIPANAYSGSYSSTWTLTVSSGP